MLAAFSITPVGVGEDVGAQVAAAIAVIRASGLPNRTGLMQDSVTGSVTRPDWPVGS
ncbi:thiamine-binding protein [Nocardia farcinica]|uniref:thiamine-binding protein n=1 Tax=Nocardia farcinica TaxID=37329 RepID=UPI0015F02601|nr:thiamine-binding protein [Nocardia farcinica]MBA4858540.1 thiamine-binding protein [Nocardia farcinica]MBC9819111.1 thiamine-binding protein [Nocardia farcinica]